MASRGALTARTPPLFWLLPVTIPLGAYLSAGHFDELERVRYLLLALIAGTACALYVWLLKRPTPSNLPHCGVFVILYVGHFIQFYWLLLGNAWYPWLDSVNEFMGSDTLLEAYAQGTVALS